MAGGRQPCSPWGLACDPADAAARIAEHWRDAEAAHDARRDLADYRQATLDGPSGSVYDGNDDPDGGSEMNFGGSVAISGASFVVGASNRGCAFVFARSGATWSRQAELTNPHGAEGNLGWAVALSGGTALVGAPFLNASHCGVAYEFTRSGTTWRERAELVNPSCSDHDEFGFSVAESGSTALVGAPGENDGGAAYWQTLP
jgi:FG-GAP repeat